MSKTLVHLQLQDAVKETKVHLNLGELVGRLTLDSLPPAVWQELSTPADKLATEVERLKKRGHAAPYVSPVTGPSFAL